MDTDIAGYYSYVEGGILTKEIRVRSVWADYVFPTGYDLWALEGASKIKGYLALILRSGREESLTF